MEVICDVINVENEEKGTDDTALRDTTGDEDGGRKSGADTD